MLLVDFAIKSCSDIARLMHGSLGNQRQAIQKGNIAVLAILGLIHVEDAADCI